MLNRSPIFLNCFSRGGSNILWNMFLTHPDVCSPILETLEIFRTGMRRPKLAGYKLILLSRQPRLLDQWNLEDRAPVPQAAKDYFDKELFAWKAKTFEDTDMKFKSEGETYGLEEVNAARLVAKNNNGTILLTPMLREMYPDSTFIALTRDPFALYESFKRSNIIPNAAEFARFYGRIAGRMLEDAEKLPGYHVLKFEDLIQDPLETVQKLYGWAGLDPSKVTKLRFKAKPHLKSDGTHSSDLAVGHHFWFAPEDVGEFFQKDINTLQAQRVDQADRDAILNECGETLTKLGYN